MNVETVSLHLVPDLLNTHTHQAGFNKNANFTKTLKSVFITAIDHCLQIIKLNLSQLSRRTYSCVTGLQVDIVTSLHCISMELQIPLHYSTIAQQNLFIVLL